jgi:hypothetical protein
MSEEIQEQPQVQPQTVVTLPVDQLQALQARLAQLEGQQGAEASARQAAEAKLMIETGRADAAIAQFQSKLTEAEERSRRFAADADLRRALSQYTFAGPAAAEQLVGLFRSETTADPDPVTGGFRTRTKDHKPIDTMVRERLASPEYAHFLRAQNPGGGTGGVQASSQSPPAATGTGGNTLTPDQQYATWKAANPNASYDHELQMIAKLGLYPRASRGNDGDVPGSNKAQTFGIRRIG